MTHANPIKHTTAENYEHFLSYMYGSGARHSALLCQAYFDGADAPHEEYEAYMEDHPEQVESVNEVLRLAEDALEYYNDFDKREDAIAAIRSTLTRYRYTYAAPQPVKQEPVGWYSHKGGFNECGEGQPLYASPVQQVDLTDDEIREVLANRDFYATDDEIEDVRAVIAAYKEKQKWINT